MRIWEAAKFQWTRNPCGQRRSRKISSKGRAITVRHSGDREIVAEGAHRTHVDRDHRARLPRACMRPPRRGSGCRRDRGLSGRARRGSDLPSRTSRADSWRSCAPGGASRRVVTSRRSSAMSPLNARQPRRSMCRSRLSWNSIRSLWRIFLDCGSISETKRWTRPALRPR
jgi:hypothetical protein